MKEHLSVIENSLLGAINERYGPVSLQQELGIDDAAYLSDPALSDDIKGLILTAQRKRLYRIMMWWPDPYMKLNIKGR